MIGHLSGRKIERRPPYEFDFEAVLEAAVATGTMLEINASPDRRDMNDVHARAAAAAGIPIVINCDAHRVGGFEVARYGVATARRAWLQPMRSPTRARGARSRGCARGPARTPSAGSRQVSHRTVACSQDRQTLVPRERGA